MTPATGEPFAHPFPVARLAACPPTHRPAAVTPTAAIPPRRSRSDPAIAGPLRDLLVTSIFSLTSVNLVGAKPFQGPGARAAVTGAGMVAVPQRPRPVRPQRRWCAHSAAGASGDG